jgi:LPPG:FO 2-phospho-L-lactate transferase
MNEQQTDKAFTRVVALAGGVGGAKLAAGLQVVLPAGALTVVVNTADDFRLWGLHISPDIDTVMYTLAGLANRETGWGLAGDTWKSLEMLARYGRDTWFRLGDMDLATHILRTQMLHEGRTHTEATADLASALNIPSRILPMSDQPVETLVETPEGTLDFQDYFVRRRHSDVVTGVVFRGADKAHPTPEVAAAIEQADVILFCPSNPIVSIGPILSVLGMRESLERSTAVRVAVSPIVGGHAVKGPAAHMLHSLGHEVSAVGVAHIYKALLDGMVIDSLDANLAQRIEEIGIAVHITDTIMKDDASRAALAEQTLNFGISLGKKAHA